MDKKKSIPVKTLGLNMIIGPGDGLDLERCLLSCQALELFDEVVLVVTTEDKTTNNMVNTYASDKCKVLKHKWDSDEYPLGHPFTTIKDSILFCDHLKTSKYPVESQRLLTAFSRDRVCC